MPGFADSMTDEQIAALLDYLRTRFSKQPPWTDIAATVRNARHSQNALLQNSSSSADTSKRDRP